MSSTLKIEIETEKVEEIFPLLQHVFREITEHDYSNPDVDLTSYIDGEDWKWLVIPDGKLKGRYYWNKVG